MEKTNKEFISDLKKRIKTKKPFITHKNGCTRINCSRCRLSLEFSTDDEPLALQLATKSGWTILKTKISAHGLDDIVDIPIGNMTIEQVPYCLNCMNKIQTKKETNG